MSNRWWGVSLSSCLLSAVISSPTATAALIFEDNFDIGGDSVSTGFGTNGVNTTVPARWSGVPDVVAVPNLGWFPFGTPKPATAYSIKANALDVALATGAGRVALSNNGGASGSVYNFANALGVGSGEARYTVEITMGLDSDATGTARTSFMWGDNVVVQDSDIALQLLDSGNDLQVYIRIDSSNRSSGGDLNALVGTLSGRAGQLVDFAIDFTDRGSGVGNESDFAITATSGSESFMVTDTDVLPDNSWRFSGSLRTLALDTAQNEGATYDNARITLIPEPGSLCLAVLAASGLLLARQRTAA